MLELITEQVDRVAMDVLRRSNGNRSQAARLLGVSRRTLEATEPEWNHSEYGVGGGRRRAADAAHGGLVVVQDKEGALTHDTQRVVAVSVMLPQQ